MLSIDDAIEKLQEIRTKHGGNLEVCKIGHFGEINEMHKSQIYARKGEISMSNTNTKMVVNIDTPDIGPEPD